MDIIKKYWNNELFRGSFILLVLINVANVLNYVFHFVMARMLGPADYGILAVLASMAYIFGVPSSSIQTLVSRHTTRFMINKDYGKIKGMLNFMLKEAFVLGFGFFVLFWIASIFLSGYLHISFWLLIIIGLFIFGAFLNPVGLGILQGMKKFSAWGWNAILASTIKLIIAIALVMLGFGVYGPTIGFSVCLAISFFFIFPYIKEITNSRSSNERIAILSRSSISTLVSMLVITLMYSLDIIFAKVFFPADIAGKYSVISMIGKMILFGTSSISGAMFPISSERFLRESKEHTKTIIKKTYLIIISLCAIALIFLGLFPKFFISLLFGSQYADISGVLFTVALAYSFLSMTNTFVLYKLSVYEFRIRHSLLLFMLLIVQVALFFAFNTGIQAFSSAFMASSALTLIISIIFIRKWGK